MRISDEAQTEDLLMVRMPDYEEMGIPRLLAAFCCRIARIKDENFAGVEFILREKMSDRFSSSELSALPRQVRDFDSAAQNRMVRYVFDQQVIERQKGLI